MSRHASLLAVVLVALGCGGPRGSFSSSLGDDVPPAVDVASDRASDTGMDVALLPDVPSIDAPAVDAPATDAPATDAPATDTPVADDTPSTDVAPSCPGGDTRCGADCVDPRTSPAHCGGCGRACAASESCAAGVCTTLPSDCRTVPCPMGTYCNLGDGVCRPGCLADSECPQPGTCDATHVCRCASGTHRCGTVCLPDTSPANCGASCSPCASLANAASTCTAGACGFTCNAGYHRCGDACASDTSVEACGAACTRCPAAPANGTVACTSGACVTRCNAGYHLCGTTCALDTSVEACGASCARCPAAPTNGTVACTGGACVTQCNAGYHRCGDACLADASPASCGSACSPCAAPAHGVATCASGACGFTCEAGWGNCDGVATNGCEADLSSSAANCGLCRSACTSSTGSTRACTGGTCLLTCQTNYANCDGAASNGCETLTSTDLRNCGRCGVVCPAPANTAASCAAGRCGYSCRSGYGDCDGDPSNGCERALNTDVSHCGRCDNACPSGPNGVVGCGGGTCGFTCSSGYVDCDNNRNTGCEVVIATDPNNCGTCGTVCALAHASAGCAVGDCTVASCNAGFGNCDALAANGCETALGASPANCGACGAACPGYGSPGTTATCTSSVCGATCLAGFSNCDGVAANGCEANLASDARNCGACGTACPAGQACVARACTAAAPAQLATARYQHAAVTATDGRVYVWGGVGTDYLTSMEMYDPATNTWTSRAPLPSRAVSRLPVGAPLADGRLLSIGGFYPFDVSRSVYLYNPVTDAWTSTGPLANAREGAAATLGADGRVYVFGGSNSAGNYVNSAEVYTPSTGTWRSIRAPFTARQRGTAVTAADGRIYLVGGFNSGGVAAVDIYDPVSDSYTFGTRLPSAPGVAGVAMGADGLVYLAGGRDSSGYLATATSFFPGGTTFNTLAPTSLARTEARLVALQDGRLLFIGGNNGSPLNRVEAYSPSDDVWR